MRNILHLCADIGSDSFYYRKSEAYNVIQIGQEIGVENYSADLEIHGIIANPVCTEFSTLKGFQLHNADADLTMVKHCQRIIQECSPVWWVLENPANGTLKSYLGKPVFFYQPWEYGSPWTKKTALWGQFNIPKKLFFGWSDVRTNDKLYIRPNRLKPSLAYLHKNDVFRIPEFEPFIDSVKTDADLRSLCSQGFARAFFEANP